MLGNKPRKATNLNRNRIFSFEVFKMKKLFFVLPVIVVCLAAVASAQEEAEPEAVSLPDYVMKQVVEQIVVDHFSSSRRKGEIYFSEQNIKREWLPKMAKIEF